MSEAAYAAAAPNAATVARKELLELDLVEETSVRWVSEQRTRENTEEMPRANMIVMASSDNVRRVSCCSKAAVYSMQVLGPL